MKTFIKEKAWLIAPVCFVAACITSVMYVRASNEVERLKFSELISKQQYSLLQDQLRDVEYKMSSNGTYEEGFKAALLKTEHPESGTFQEGYEAAKLVFGNGSYVDGYHNAIAQFGWKDNCTRQEMKVMDASAKKTEIKDTPKPEISVELNEESKPEEQPK